MSEANPKIWVVEHNYCIETEDVMGLIAPLRAQGGIAPFIWEPADPVIESITSSGTGSTICNPLDSDTECITSVV